MKNATFTDSDGKEKPYYMGCYGIGIGRTMAAVVEISHDDRGIIWPEQISPFKIHIVGLDLNDERVRVRAEQVYEQLTEQFGSEVLFDDRTETRAGEKFADADLIGITHRIIISRKTGAKVEYKLRSEQESKLLSVDEFGELVSRP